MTISPSNIFRILPVHVYIITVCIIIGFISLQRKKHPPHLVLFITYLSLTLVVELAGYTLRALRRDNAPIYNIYIIVNFAYLIFLLRSFLRNERIKRIFSWSIFTFVVIALINIFFIQGFYSFNTYTFIIGSIIMVICCIYYFYQRMKFPDSQSLLRDPTFWLSTGLLFFYTCSLPIFGLNNFVANIPLYIYNSFYLINQLLNIILYSLFMISLLCNLNFRKSSS